MTLTTKVVLILIGVFLLYAFGNYGIQYRLIFPSFLKLERYEAQQNLDRAIQAIRREIHYLDVLCHDWAAWDDTHTFMSARSDAYIESNLGIATFLNNRLNLIYLVGLDGEVSWGKIYDLHAEEQIALSQFPPDAFPQNHSLLKMNANGRAWADVTVNGVLMTMRAPMLIAARPILTSANLEPRRGTLIMGRFLDQDVLETLIQQTRVNFRIFTADTLPEELHAFSRQPSDDVEIKNAEYLHLYKECLDIDGQPAFWVKTTIPRDIVRRGFVTIRYALISILVAGVIVLVVMLLLLQQTVLGPISLLTRHVLAIRQQADFSVRLAMNRYDEIGMLAREFDSMVAQIERQTTELARINTALKEDIVKRQQAEKALQQANQELENLAAVDGLTQIANRRRFDQDFAREWKRAAREQTTLSVILGDIDYFKAYNDTYGHLAGDDCLRSVAQLLTQYPRRPPDLVARYGGEEFIVMLPNTSPEGALHVAETFRAALEQRQLPHQRSSIIPCVTMSLGIAGMIPSPDQSPDMLIELADQALYEAKRQGRNRCVLTTAVER